MGNVKLTNRIIEDMNSLENLIYDNDPTGWQQMYIGIIDMITELLYIHPGLVEGEIGLHMQNNLISLQNAFDAKDLIRINDCIQYVLKPIIIEVREIE